MIRTYASQLTAMALAAARCLTARCLIARWLTARCLTARGLTTLCLSILCLTILCLTALSTPAHAQEQVRLRAAYQGGFLPDGTSIVVLARDAREEQGDRIQPEFISRESFPRREELVHRRDVLEDGGFSSRRYEPSDQADRVYFLYALGPDSTLYWSYSAERDALKFDVVSTGVMSVAPIRTREIRDEILDAFFGQRVVVRMPGDGSNEPGGAMREGAMRNGDAAAANPAAGDALREAYADALLEDASGDDSAGRMNRTDAGAPDGSENERAAAQLTDPGDDATMQSDAGERSAQNVGTTVVPPADSGNPLVAFVILVLVAAAVGAAYFARKYYQEARRLRLHLIAVKEHAPSVDGGDARRELEALRRAHESLQRKHAALEHRIAASSGQPAARE